MTKRDMDSGRENDADGELEPCTEEAREAGCICRLSPVSSASLNPPRAIIVRDCPLHGIDPDAEYERRRDEGDR